MHKITSKPNWILNHLNLKLSVICVFWFIGAFSKNIEESVSIKTTPSFEKLYLHFDKPYYYAGEDIWFKVYLFDGKTNKSGTLSKVVYVDLIDPDNKIVVSRTIKINKFSPSKKINLYLAHKTFFQY